MANPEACEVYIDQEIVEGHENGETDEVIGRRVSVELLKLFEAKIKARTIAQRARRTRVTDVTNTQTPSNHTEKEDGEMEDQKDILCKNCKENIRERTKRDGGYYYNPHGLCRGCRNERDGKPKTQKKKKDDLEKAVQEAEKTQPVGNVTYLSDFIIAHLEGVPKSDEGRIKLFGEVFCWIKNIFEKESIDYEC